MSKIASWPVLGALPVGGFVVVTQPTVDDATKSVFAKMAPGALTTLVPEAPNDGSAYGRQSLGWSKVLPLVGGTLTGALTGPTIAATGAMTLGGASVATVAQLPVASSTAPLMDNIAAVGTGTTWARADHVHPTDTSRAAVGALPVASSTPPVMNGAVAIGISATYARADHVHPVDTSRASTAIATTASVGLVKPDGTTITIDGTGKLTSIGGVAAAGGAVNQIQFNSAGVLGGFTMSGDATLAVGSGVITVTKTNGIAFGAVAAAGYGPAPVMDGVAAAGVATTVSRSDHVHPTDTTLYPASNPSGYQTAAQIATALGAYLPLTGGTVTGALTVTNVVFGYKNATIGGGVGSQANGWAAGFNVNSSGTLTWGNLDLAGVLTGPRMTLDTSSKLVTQGTSLLLGNGDFGFTTAGNQRQVLWTNAWVDTFDMGNGTRTWNSSGAVLMTLAGSGSGLTVNIGDLTCNAGNISAGSGKNVTAGNAVLGDHILAFRSGAVGGTTGSWETASGKAFGFRVVGADGTAQFGPADPASGNLTGTVYYMTPTGNFTAALKGYQPGGGSWADASDARAKDVLGDYEHGLTEVLALKPIRYKFRQDFGGVGPLMPTQQPGEAVNGTHTAVAEAGTEFIGLVAQDAELVMPEMVSFTTGVVQGEQVDDLRVLDTSALPFALINAVRELDNRVRALEGASTT